METACIWTITLLYIYLCIWGLDFRLNNINYICWYYSSPIIIISLYWTSETLLSSIARSKNKKVVRVVAEIKKVEVKVLREDKWQIEEDLVLKEEKIYVLNSEKLRTEIIWLYHNVPVAEHEES